MRGAIAFLIVLAMPAAARAGEVDDGAVEEIEELVFDGHAGEAYQRLGPLVEAHPRDARLLYLASEAAVRTARRQEARWHVDAGLAVAPDDEELLAQSGFLFLVSGDFAAARAPLARAVQLDPDDEFATDTMAWLEEIEQARARRAGKTPDLDPASAAWVVDHVLERMFDGATPSELITYVSPEIMKDVLPADRTRKNLQGYAETFAAGLAKTAEQEQQEVDGWVLGDETVDGEHTRIFVGVALHQIHSKASVDEVLASLDDEDATGWATLREPFAEVDVAERPALIGRLIGMRTQVTITYTVELAKVHDVFKITNVSWAGNEMQSDIAEYVEGTYDSGGDSGDAPLSRLRPTDWARLALPAAGLLAGLVLLVVYLVRRISARRALARANRRG